MIGLNPQKFTMMTSFRNWITNGSIDDVGRLMRADADNMGKMTFANADDVEYLNEFGLFVKKNRPLYEVTIKRSRWASEEMLNKAHEKVLSVLSPCMTMDDDDCFEIREAFDSMFYEMYCYDVTIVVKVLMDNGMVTEIGTMTRKVYDPVEFALEGFVLDAYGKYNDV